MKGRKPTPTVLKKLHRSEEPINPLEPIPAGALTDALPEPPDYFNADQRATWEYAIRHSPPGMLKLIDVGALEKWVVHDSMFRAAMRAQNRTSLLHRQGGENSLPVPSPYIGIANKQSLLAAKWADQLGFTPVSRPRIMAGGAVPATGRNDNLTLANGRDAPEESIETYLASAPRPSSVH